MIGTLLFGALAGLMGLLAAWVYAARPTDTLNRLLAAALVLYAGAFVVFHLYRQEVPGSTAAQPYLETIFIFEVPALVLMLFVLDRLFLDHPRTRARSITLWGLAGLAGVMLVSLQLWPSSWHRDLREGALGLASGFTFGDLYGVGSHLVMAWAVYLGARVAGNAARRPIQRCQGAMVAISFAFLAGHTAGLATSGVVLHPERVLAVHNLPAWTAAMLGLFPLAYAILRVPRAFQDRLGPTLILLTPLVAGILDNTAGGLFVLTGLDVAFGGGSSRPLWLVAFAVGMTLAVVRYGLAGFGEQGRDRLVHTGIPLSLVLLGLGGSAAAWLAWGATGPGLVLGLGILILPVGLALHPPLAWSRRLVDRVLLDQGDPAVLEERVRLYSAALRSTWQATPSPVGPRAEDLAALREELGLTARDHAVLSALHGPTVVETPPDRVLGRYVVGEEIGRGGTARVFLGRDALTGREVVLKRVRVPGGMSQPVLREVQALSRIDHPHVLSLYDAAETQEGLLLVLEHAAGGSLADRLAAGGPLPVAEAARLVLEVARGLQAVHQAGLVHGDVKPENVLLTSSGRCKLADFGSARAATRDPEVTVTLSVSGASLCAMAPEQVRGKGLAHTTDVYSLGTLLYRLVTGEHYLPLEGRIELEAHRMILESAPRLPHPAIPGPVATVLSQMLAKPADQRPQSMEAVQRALLAAVPEATDQADGLLDPPKAP